MRVTIREPRTASTTRLISASRPTNELDLYRQVAQERVQRSQRRKRRREARPCTWNTRAASREVAQPMLTQIDELDVVIVQQLAGATETTIWPPCATLISRAARFTPLP